MKNKVIVLPQQLFHYMNRILQSVGASPEVATAVANSLLDAELRGVTSHGAVRLPIYVERIRRKLVNPSTRGRIVSDRGSVVVLDGEHGLGAAIGMHAVEIGIDRAKNHGLGAVAVRNSTHFGIGATYVRQGFAYHLISVAVSNGPPTMAVWGGCERVLGTNPIAIGIPLGRNVGMVLDMATSVVARGRIILAARRGERIPEGWAVDSDGNPTTDPHAALAGAVLPFGGPKGSGLALVVEVLAGLLSDGLLSKEIADLYEDFSRPQGVSHFFLFMDVSWFVPLERWFERAEMLVAFIKSGRRMNGVEEILLPGEREDRKMRDHLNGGIPLPIEVWKDIVELGLQVGVRWEDAGRDGT